MDGAASRRGFKARAIDLYRFSEGARPAAAGIGTDMFRKRVGPRWRSVRPGPELFPDVRCSAPGPPDREPVVIGLDDPMRVSRDH